MKAAALIFLLMLTRIVAHAQTDPIRGNQFHLTGKIIEKVQLPADCGIIAQATVFKFEVIKLTGMSYPNKNIGIVVCCPEFYGKDYFQKGKSYQLVFSDQNQADFGWLIHNKDLLSKNGLSFEPYAVSVKRE